MIAPALFISATALMALYAGEYARKASRVRLRYFGPAEFGQWWPLMSDALLQKLDTFRHRWGQPVQISPAPGSLGRLIPPGAPGFASQHNVTRWGEVRAADIMPLVLEPVGDEIRRRGMTRAELQRAAELAEAVGFRGIGAAPDWRPYPGLHVDVREDRREGDPATWAELRVDGVQRVDFPIVAAWS